MTSATRSIVRSAAPESPLTGAPVSIQFPEETFVRTYRSTDARLVLTPGGVLFFGPSGTGVERGANGPVLHVGPSVTIELMGPLTLDLSAVLSTDASDSPTVETGSIPTTSESLDRSTVPPDQSFTTTRTSHSPKRRSRTPRSGT